MIGVLHHPLKLLQALALHFGRCKMSWWPQINSECTDVHGTASVLINILGGEARDCPVQEMQVPSYQTQGEKV